MEYLKDTQYFDEGALTGVIPLNSGENYSSDEGNFSVLKVGYNLNNYSSPRMRVDIPYYQFQTMNVNQIKDNMMKIKTSI